MTRASSANRRSADNDTIGRARRVAPHLVSTHPAAEAPLPPAVVEAGAPQGAGTGGTSILPTSTAGPAASFEQLGVGDIVIPPDRLRQADPAKVAAYAHSLTIVGQLQPIRVEREANGQLTLVAGLHRVLAAREAKLATIEALVTPAQGADQRRLTEILENLMRAELVALDRAVALSELKAIHERMYPQTRHGRAPKGKVANIATLPPEAEPILRFTAAVADKVGLSERAIRLSVEIAVGLGAEVRARLQGTRLADHQAGLLDLAALDAAMQHKVLDLLLSEPPGAANVVDAVALAEGKRPRSEEPDPLVTKELNRLGRWTDAERARLWLARRDEIEAVFAAEDARVAK